MPISKLEDRMSREYREGLAHLRDVLDTQVKAGKTTPAGRAKLLTEWVDTFAQRAASRRTELGLQTADRANVGGVASVAQSASQLTQGFGSTASAGLSDFARAQMGPLGGVTPEQERVAMEAEAANSSVSRGIGEMAGYFAGIPAQIGKGATQLTGRMLLGPTTKVASYESAAGAIGRVGLEGLRGAMAGGGTAVSTAALEGLIAGKSRDQITADLWLPMAFGTTMGGSMGTLAGLARVPKIDAAGIELVDRLKKVLPGFRPDPSFLRQSSMLQSLLRYSANSPIGRKLVNTYYKKAYVEPLRQGLADLRRRIAGPLSPSLAETARDIRVAVGSSTHGKGAYQNQIQAKLEPAFASEGDKIISPELTERVLAGLGALDDARASVRGTLGERSGALSGIGVEVRNLARIARLWTIKGMPVRGTHQGLPKSRQLASGIPEEDLVQAPQITIQEFENLKQRARAIAQFDAAAQHAPGTPQYSSLDVKDARRIYDLLSAAERETSSVIDNVMREVRPLRKWQENMRPLVDAAENADDRVLFDRVFAGNKPLRTLAALHKVQTPEARQRLAAQYFSDFLEEVTRGTPGEESLLGNKVLRMLASHGKWRQEMFDAVLGAGSPASGAELRNILLDVVSGMDRAARAVGSKEGSQTASYLLSAGIEGSVVQSVTLLNQLFSDPRIVLNRLPLAGGVAFGMTLLRSTLDGKIAAQLDKLARGQASGAATQTPTALSRAAQGLFPSPSAVPEERPQP